MAKYVHYTNATDFNKNNRYKNQYVSRKLRFIYNLIFRSRVPFSNLKFSNGGMDVVIVRITLKPYIRDAAGFLNLGGHNLPPWLF